MPPFGANRIPVMSVLPWVSMALSSLARETSAKDDESGPRSLESPLVTMRSVQTMIPLPVRVKEPPVLRPPSM
ncbi:hypothetical protein D3C86_1896050 [compost metagenome]